MGVESVSAELMEEDLQRGVHPNKWSSWRDSETETWIHFGSCDGVININLPATVEGIYLTFKC